MEPDGRSPFGVLLRQFRLAAGLSQEALAERARVSTQGVSALERGTRRTPQRDTLVLLANALALSSEDRARFEASASRPSVPRTRSRSGVTQHDTVFHALPAALTSFHGRDGDVDGVARAVVEDRLVTLTGTGGVGKTRLALETARTLGDRFPDGIYFVELASIGNGDLVLHRMAEVIGAPLESTSLLSAIIAAVRSRHALLILDTCEHVLVNVAAFVRDIVQRTQHVHVLATSRQALSVAGEVVRGVSSLPTPDPASTVSAEDAMRHSSVALFCARARAAGGSFELTDTNATGVAEICRRVDGIPLAIELVAPQVTVLSPRDIAQLLRERFRLLTAPVTAASPRQQTMRAILDWSFDLLDERERILFRRLGAFSGGWTVELARCACADEHLSSWDVLDALTTLVAKSLVAVDGSGEARRFRLLESTRAYAGEHLESSAEFDAMMERLTRALAEYVRELRTLWAAMDDMAWQRAIGAERDNIRAVLGWSFATGHAPDVSIGLLVNIVGPELVFEAREVRLWYDAAGTLIDHVGDAELVARFAHCSAKMAMVRRESPQISCALAERAVDLARHVDDTSQLGDALRVYGTALRDALRFEDAERAFLEGWRIIERSGSVAAKATLLSDWALLDLSSGTVDVARDRLQQCLRISRAGSTVYANTLATLGELTFSTGDIRSARLFAEQALVELRALNSRVHLGVASCNAAAYAIAENDLDEAQDAIDEGLSVLRETGMPYWIAIALEHVAVIATLRGDDERGLPILGYTQHYISGEGRRRESTEKAGYDRAIGLLEQRHGSERLVARFAEGAMLDESRTIELAESHLTRSHRAHDSLTHYYTETEHCS